MALHHARVCTQCRAGSNHRGVASRPSRLSSQDGSTALHLAVKSAALAVIEVLLARGAKKSLQDKVRLLVLYGAGSHS